MFESKIEKNIKEGEEVIRIVRKYPLVFCWPIFWSAIFIIAPFFFLVPLWQWGRWGVGLFFISLVFGLLLGVRVAVLYSLNIFVITSERIIDIDQTGFFSRTVSETTYDKIQDVSYSIKGIMQTFLHYGDVIIQTAGQQVNLELNSVKDPEKIQQVIIHVKQDNS
ncbi:MAG: PH domain-containing protein [Patescibacteria group bacterium]|jgi:membrane protein YdbS with pleckstrin-like domain